MVQDHTRGTGSRFVNHLLSLGTEITWDHQEWNVHNFHLFPFLGQGSEIPTVGDYLDVIEPDVNLTKPALIAACYLTYRRVVGLRLEEIEIYKDFKNLL